MTPSWWLVHHPLISKMRTLEPQMNHLLNYDFKFIRLEKCLKFLFSLSLQSFLSYTKNNWFCKSVSSSIYRYIFDLSIRFFFFSSFSITFRSELPNKEIFFLIFLKILNRTIDRCIDQCIDLSFDIINFVFWEKDFFLFNFFVCLWSNWKKIKFFRYEFFFFSLPIHGKNPHGK